MAGRKIVIEFLGKDVSADKTARAVEQRFGKLGARMDRVGQIAGKVLAGGLVVGAAAAVKLGEKASDLAETQSKVAQIFGGESAAALDKFASGAAKSIGQSKQAALDAAATFGVFGKAAGLTGKDLTGFSTDLTTLSSDMASFSNTSPEEAVEAIGAALRGESEPIRKYGVLLDDATLKNRALKLGLINTTKQALTPQQKALAAQAEIMAQTKDQQGDFARTSDGLANKQRILRAQLENLGTKIGTLVLPAMNQMVTVGLNLTNWVSRHTTLVGTLAVGIGAVAGVLWATSVAMRAAATASALWSAVTKAAAAVQWVLNAAMAANPIGLVVLAIAGLIAVLVLAWNHSSTFRAIVTGAFTAVKNAAAAAFGWVRSNWPLLLAILTGPIGLAVLAIVKHWDRIKEGAAIVKNFVVDKFGDMRDRLIAIKNRMTFDGMFDGIKSAFRAAVNFIIGKWNSLSFTIGGGSIGGKKIPSITLGTPDIPYLATGGTVTRSGSALVGEAGPELLDLPRGARVTPLSGSSAGSEIQPRPLVVQLIVEGRQLGQALIDWQAATGETLRVRTT